MESSMQTLQNPESMETIHEAYSQVATSKVYITMYPLNVLFIVYNVKSGLG